MKLKLITLATILLFAGCSSTQQNLTVNKEAVEKTKNKIEQSISSADDARELNSQWFYKRDSRVPLTVVNMAYTNPKIKDTVEYKRYVNILNTLNKNPKALDEILGVKISDKFFPIKVVDFDSSEESLLKFTSSYKNRHSDKEILTDILRPDYEKPSAEILLRLDFDKLQDGVLSLEGY
nr:hypothetical protein [Sulfurovaceae bacterium]